MMTKQVTIVTGTVLDEDTSCTLAEVCGMCGVPADFILEMIDEGMLCPSGASPREWRFSALEIKRIQTTLRLQRDLRVNLPGCALVVELLEELEELRRLYRMR